MADFAKSSDISVQEQLDRINALSPGRDILGLERISALMTVLGNPHQNLPAVFHVAGTNGKGSTCSFLRAAIEAAGMKCHVYTSPHLVRFNERIRLAGSLITDDALTSILTEVLDIAESNDLHPSFFEVTTAAALLAFSRIPADACIIEVGLGGRLDATNVIKSPVVCGIANLGIDHEGFLLSPEDNAPKDPLCRIAWEKAGIAKKSSPLVAGQYQPKMNAIIAEHAQKTGTPLYIRGLDWDIDDNFNYSDDNGSMTLPQPAMNGPHQNENAALAVAMLRHQNAIQVSQKAIRQAIQKAHWPARLQLLNNGPLQNITPDHEIWLDGGHNRNAGDVLAKHFDAVVLDNKKHIHLIIGMLSNKDPQSLIAPLQHHIKSISVLPVEGHEHHEAAAFAMDGIITIFCNNIQSALQSIVNLASDDIILIAGSLYLAGEVLTANEQYPD